MRKTLFLGLLAVMTVSWAGMGIVSSSAMTFEKIEGGSFTMGSPSDEPDRDDDEDQADVTITKSFEIMTTEVTQLQWFRVMEGNPSHFSSKEYCGGEHWVINEVELCPDHPVEQVSWDDVQEFIKKLNDSLGLSGCYGTPRDKKGCYRLPTEAEWGFAARGGTQTAYSFGDDHTLLGDYARYWGNSSEQTHPVGGLLANPNGLFDMHGNVWEWVQDWYTEELPGGDDPLHSSSGSYRVFRGGSWGHDAQNLRSAYRNYISPGSGFSDVGFRLVRNL